MAEAEKKKQQQEEEAQAAAAKKKQEEDDAQKKEEQKNAEAVPAAKPNPFGAALRAPARLSTTANNVEKPKPDAGAKPVNMFLQKIQQEKELKLKMQQNLGEQMKKWRFANSIF